VNAAVKTAIYVLEALFTCGVLGSCIVVLLSMVEDLEVGITREPNDGRNGDQVSTHPDLTTT
jgi:hypothetical protein